MLRSLAALKLRAPRTMGLIRSLFIQVESTPNPDSLKFLPASRIVLDERFGAGLHFDRSTTAATAGAESKFAKTLLKTAAVTSVFLGRDFVSVNKTEDASWAVSAKRSIP
jgi:NFU1 iron-sulfur cluster scaffold homolog, mitochondrial